MDSRQLAIRSSPKTSGGITQQASTSRDPHETSYTWPDGKLQRAINHEHIRSQLLQQAEASHSWVHPQPDGHAPDDRTAPVAYPPDQLGWGFHDRSCYPPINFVLHQQDYRHPNYEVGYLQFNGLLVLDLEDKPVKGFHHIPLTVSSRIPGGHIEALLRLDDRATYADIRARMPPRVMSIINGQSTWRPVKKLGALSTAAARYREEAGCLVWHDRMGSSVLNDYILANLPEELKLNNTTRGWRNLTEAEIAAIRAPAIGTRPQQARKRASSAEMGKKRKEYIKQKKQKAEAMGVDFSEDQTSIGVAGLSRGGDEDARQTRPCGDHEMQALQRALQPTCQQVIALVGAESVKYDRLPYKDQLRGIDNQLHEIYQTLNRDEDVPNLMQLTKWSGGIKNWRWSAKFWDGKSVYKINDHGAVGDKIMDTDDPKKADDVPVTLGLGDVAEAEQEDQLNQEDEASGDDTDKTQSGHDSDEESDGSAVAGAYRVDGRGNLV